MNKVNTHHFISAAFKSLRAIYVLWAYGVLLISAASACGDRGLQPSSNTGGSDTLVRSDDDQNKQSTDEIDQPQQVGISISVNRQAQGGMEIEIDQPQQDHGDLLVETSQASLVQNEPTAESPSINRDLDSEPRHNPVDSPAEPSPEPPEAIAHITPPAGQEKIQVKLILSGLKIQQGGDVCVAIYNNSHTFLTTSVFRWQCISVDQVYPAISLFLPSPGEYAFSVLHDEDKNNKLTRSLIGFPKEGFGFSNNPPVRTGPPAFDHVSTWIDKAKSIMIKMTYLNFT